MLFRILDWDLHDRRGFDEDEQEEPAVPPGGTPVRDDVTAELMDPYGEGLEPPGREGPAAGRYWCPRCGSDDVIVQEEGPNPVSAGGVVSLDRLKSLARSAGSAWGLRFCRGCGYRW